MTWTSASFLPQKTCTIKESLTGADALELLDVEVGGLVVEEAVVVTQPRPCLEL